LETPYGAMSWQLSPRKIARIEALEERTRNKTRPPIFAGLENGDTFFYHDRTFTKIGPILARELGAATYERIDEYAEVEW
jgi:hypothetical protein